MKPLAPARSAAKTYSSRPNVVSISTRTLPPSAATIRRVASIPSRCGMRMSSTATSGRLARAASTACSPSAASATTVMSGSVVDDLAQAAADERLVVGEQDADAHAPPPAIGSRARTA